MCKSRIRKKPPELSRIRGLECRKDTWHHAGRQQTGQTELMLPEQGITFCKREEYCADEPVLSPDLHSSPQQPVTREINNWLLFPVQSNSEKKEKELEQKAGKGDLTPPHDTLRKEKYST